VRAWSPFLPFVLAALAVGCSETIGTGQDDDAVVDDDDHSSVALDPCTFADDPVGTIRIEEGYSTLPGEAEPAWHAQVVAQLWDGPIPAVYTEVLAGECRLRLADWAECDHCGLDEFCVADDVCEPYPGGASGGALTVTGLDEALILAPESYNPGLYYGPDDLPTDLFSAGDPLAATLAGDVYPPAALAARGVAPMDPALGDAYQLQLPFDEDLEIQWDPAADPDACVRLDIRAPTRGHGLTIGAFLSCASSDDGSITIPAGLLSLFPESVCPVIVGSNCYYSELTRYTSSTVETDLGDLSLQVRNAVYFYYDHRR
jgi:hypothetical protein